MLFVCAFGCVCVWGGVGVGGVFVHLEVCVCVSGVFVHLDVCGGVFVHLDVCGCAFG